MFRKIKIKSFISKLNSSEETTRVSAGKKLRKLLKTWKLSGENRWTIAIGNSDDALIVDSLINRLKNSKSKSEKQEIIFLLTPLDYFYYQTGAWYFTDYEIEDCIKKMAKFTPGGEKRVREWLKELANFHKKEKDELISKHEDKEKEFVELIKRKEEEAANILKEWGLEGLEYQGSSINDFLSILPQALEKLPTNTKEYVNNKIESDEFLNISATFKILSENKSLYDSLKAIKSWLDIHSFEITHLGIKIQPEGYWHFAAERDMVPKSLGFMQFWKTGDNHYLALIE